MTNRLCCLTCALLFLIGGFAEAADFSGKVIAVLDGDTMLVLRGGSAVKVRLAEVDAPEKGQPYGTTSQKSLAGLVMGKQIRVTSRAVDDYGRLVATVHANELNVNHEQVRRGMAWEYSRYRPRHVTGKTTSHSTGQANNTRQAAGYGEASRLRERAEDGTPAPEGCAPPCRAVNSNRELVALQREAQQARRGLWAGTEAIEPSQWRKQHPGTVQTHAAASPAAASAACGSKKYCSQMSSCDEAVHYLKQCGLQTLDGNGDGVPCEKLCSPVESESD